MDRTQIKLAKNITKEYKELYNIVVTAKDTLTSKEVKKKCQKILNKKNKHRKQDHISWHSINRFPRPNNIRHYRKRTGTIRTILKKKIPHRNRRRLQTIQ